MRIAKVTYDWGIRYWHFGEEFVEDVYDEVDGTLQNNKSVALIFDDMSIDELTNACKDKYPITWQDA